MAEQPPTESTVDPEGAALAAAAIIGAIGTFGWYVAMPKSNTAFVAFLIMVAVTVFAASRHEHEGKLRAYVKGGTVVVGILLLLAIVRRLFS